MNLVLGVDLGTTYFKLGLFDRSGALQGLSRIPVAHTADDATRCEVDVAEFWRALKTGLAEALARAHAGPEEIAAVGYSSQANSFIMLDAGDRPLTPLILWPDQRAKAPTRMTDALWAREDFLAVTGMGTAHGPGLAIEKIAWLRRTRPDLWPSVARIMTLSDYFTYALTGRRVGDAGTASLLGILDVRHLRWWPEAIQALRIPASLLSTPIRPGSLAGPLTREGALRLGLPAGIPLAVGSLDHHVASLGAGRGTTAPFSESTGTVLACVGHADNFTPRPGVCVGAGFDARGYYNLAFDANGGSVLEWYQKTHAPEISFPRLDALAQRVPPDCDGLVARPSANRYPGLEGFRNVTARHTPAHFARAIMVSTAASLAALIDRLSPEQRPDRIVATGGGAKSDFWLQLKADLLGVPFVRTHCEEPACNGAAMLAAVARGWFDTPHHAGRAWIQERDVFAPTCTPTRNEVIQ